MYLAGEHENRILEEFSKILLAKYLFLQKFLFVDTSHYLIFFLLP